MKLRYNKLELNITARFIVAVGGLLTTITVIYQQF